MSWIFDKVPYLLAFGTIILGVFDLIKNADEYKKKPRLRRAVIVVFVIVGVLTVVSLYHDNREKKDAQIKAEAEMRVLQGKVDTANQAQENNTKSFLAAISQMSAEVSQLKAEVRTEALQKKLLSVQADLHKTQQALAPGPKAELSFTFAPFNNPAPPEHASPVTEITLPRLLDGSFHVEFNILNLTNVDAVDISSNISICDDCKFAKEPEGLTKLPGMRDSARWLRLDVLHAREANQTLSLDVIPPSWARRFAVVFSYRCRTCIVPAMSRSFWVNTAH